ncbi:MAG: hypothetical protein IB618_02480 [Candidatus Pacearchaeota archaeon]|nr:MAG: hypothetical protein IB618_02480 [Candidatus Pacearchaeota archaeon]
MTEEDILKEVGLNDKEIKVYLRLLELGQSPILRLAEITGINRTSLYDILEALLKKGIVGYTIIEHIKQFYASDPKILLEQLKEKEKKLQQILPKLKEKQKIIGKKPLVEFYEGKKGIDVVHLDVLKEKQEILAYGSFTIINKLLQYQGIDFRKKRISKKIKLRGISDSSILDIKMWKKPAYRRLTQVRILEELKELPTWTHIYSDKVAILSFQKENFIGIIIHDKAVNLTQRFIFEQFWKKAKSIKI